ncbi:Pr6Pr family membrane protein [Actinokineospora sp. 24-640]
MRSRSAARVWFGVTAVVALAGLAVQTAVSATATTGVFTTPAGRVLNMFCFFTIQSNVIVVATSALLARDPDRAGPVFAVFRLAGLIGIAVTGVVYHTVLRGLYELQGPAHVADLLLHTASPVLTVVGWLLHGPRDRIAARTAACALLFPALWLVFTLARGPIADFYPYPFVDVTRLGYPAVLLNCLLVAALFLALAFGARVLDRALSPTARGTRR